MFKHPRLRDRLRVLLLSGTFLAILAGVASIFRMWPGAITCGAGAAGLLILAYVAWTKISDGEFKIKIIKELLIGQGKQEEAEETERAMREEQGL